MEKNPIRGHPIRKPEGTSLTTEQPIFLVKRQEQLQHSQYTIYVGSRQYVYDNAYSNNQSTIIHLTIVLSRISTLYCAQMK